jgi:hypothetical protein
MYDKEENRETYVLELLFYVRIYLLPIISCLCDVVAWFYGHYFMLATIHAIIANI